MRSHQVDGTAYQSPPVDPNTDDCTNFCSRILQNAGFDVPYHQSRQFSNSAYFVEVAAADARAGDIIWQPRNAQGDGHAGVFTGTRDNRGRYQGIQMGGSGARVGAWGPGGWFSGGDATKFYRLMVPK
jgi:hypothetical protein